MPFTPSAFARLPEPLDRRMIAHPVAAHGGDHGVGRGDNAWTCERHLTSLLLAQWAWLTNVREIVAGRGAQSQSSYHLNRHAPRLSRLADANAERPAAVFRDIATVLVPIAAGALRRESEALIQLLDATPIPLKGGGFRRNGFERKELKRAAIGNPNQRSWSVEQKRSRQFFRAYIRG